METVPEAIHNIHTKVEGEITENVYRFITLADFVTDIGIVPVVDKVFDVIEDVVEGDSEKENSGMLGTFRKTIKEFIHGIHKFTKKPIEIFDKLLEVTEDEFAQILKEEFGIDTNQWVLSKENLEVISRIGNLLNTTFAEVAHLSKLNVIRYIIAWTLIQKLYRKTQAIKEENHRLKYHQAEQNGRSHDELKEVQKECLYYTGFAHGTYGNMINYVLSGKDVSKVIDPSSISEQFLKKAQLSKEDLLYSFWDATPYRPAYAIVRDQKKKSIILCMRGSNNWADALTDLDCRYISFTVIEDDDTKERFIRYNFDDTVPAKFKHMLGESTIEFNGKYNSRECCKNATEIESGFTHSGMFVSAVQSYKEITPKLEEIFSQSEYKDYDFVITGHSLGGGMTTLMTFLYLVHPLKVPNPHVNKSMRGYTYGAASVLSKGFDKWLHSRVKSVVYNNDCVPRLSFGAAKDICKILLMFEKAEDVNKIIEFDMGEEFDNIKEEHMAQAKLEILLYKKFKNTIEKSVKLCPIGRTLHIVPNRDTNKEDPNYYEYMITEIEDKEFFEEIVFARHLVQNHFPFNYEDGLSSQKVELRPILSHKNENHADNEGAGV